VAVVVLVVQMAAQTMTSLVVGVVVQGDLGRAQLFHYLQQITL
jgi:hypothetical protein